MYFRLDSFHNNVSKKLPDVDIGMVKLSSVGETIKITRDKPATKDCAAAQIDDELFAILCDKDVYFSIEIVSMDYNRVIENYSLTDDNDIDKAIICVKNWVEFGDPICSLNASENRSSREANWYRYKDKILRPVEYLYRRNKLLEKRDLQYSDANMNARHDSDLWDIYRDKIKPHLLKDVCDDKWTVYDVRNKAQVRIMFHHPCLIEPPYWNFESLKAALKERYNLLNR
jgi:hypothetical protein